MKISSRLWFGAGLVLLGLGAGCVTPGDEGLVAPVTISQSPALPVPTDAQDRAYLGLEAGGVTFELKDVDAEIVLVDLFDLYCHSCQTASTYVHKMYDQVEAAGLTDRIRFIGLGVGDTALEANLFRKKIGLPFPVFADRKAVWAELLGGIKVPGMVALRRTNGHLEIFHRTTGVHRHPDELLAHILQDFDQLSPVNGADAAHLQSGTCEPESGECVPEEVSLR